MTMQLNLSKTWFELLFDNSMEVVNQLYGVVGLGTWVYNNAISTNCSGGNGSKQCLLINGTIEQYFKFVGNIGKFVYDEVEHLWEWFGNTFSWRKRKTS